MDRRNFIKSSAILVSSAAASGCGYLKIDPWHPYLRSEYIDTPEKEKEVLSRAKLSWTDDGRIRVLHLKGTPYEIGYQHGSLLRGEIQRNLTYIYDSAVRKFHFEEMFHECYERMAPFIPKRYIEEMHGLAHGSKLPIHIIHGIHALPEMGEWGGKKKIKTVVKSMMDGSLGTSCSNLCAKGKATEDGSMYVVRILDWGLHRISKLHEYPLIAVVKPTDSGIPYANIGWCGFLGAISGINSAGITLGEMGYGDPEGETLRGKPMPFLLRDILQEAKSLKDVRRIISTSPGTNSFVFLMSDGKTGEAELYIRDKDRFLVFSENMPIKDRGKDLPPIPDTVYGGHYDDKMIEELTSQHGKVTPELLMEKIIPNIAMPSNFQNVVYAPKSLKFWVSNAVDTKSRAAEAPYTFFDLAAALQKL